LYMSVSVPDNTMINDIRIPSQFKGFSFSEYKKLEVKNQFIEAMTKGKIEPACYWCAELLCAGHFTDIWECILYYFGKHIHIGNPKIAVYLEKRYTVFRNIIQQGFFINDYELRNHGTIRKLFAEIIVVLSSSVKKQSFETIKIDRVEEFDITQMSDRLKAPSTHFVDDIFLPKDPKELFIAVNEFAYHVSSDKKNMTSACFWIEWIIEFDLICKNRKEPVFCERRKYNVENKYQMDIIWLFWDVMIHYGKKMGPFIDSIMSSLITLFCIKYTTGCCKKRKYLLYFAVELLTEPVPSHVELISDKTMIEVVTEKIHLIYKQIKKNEHSPNTEYLFKNLDSQNTFAQSVKKLEMLQNMDFVPKLDG